MSVIPLPSKVETWRPLPGEVILMDIAPVGQCLREFRVLRVEPGILQVQMCGRWRQRFWMTEEAVRQIMKGVIGHSVAPRWWPW